MKKMMLVYTLVLFATFSMTATFCLAEEKNIGQAEKDHPWTVQGLKEFDYPRYEGFTLAALVGYSRWPCKNESKLIFESSEFQQSEKCEVVELNLVTIDGEYLPLKIVTNEIQGGLFLHEFFPDFGKYKHWTSVISVLLKYKSDTSPFPMDALRLVGRFRPEWNKELKIQKHKIEKY